MKLAPYGKLVQGAVEEVSGWTCIREVIAERQGKVMPLFGECVAMVDGFPLALVLAAAPDMLAALKALVPADFDEHPQDFAPEWHAARAAIKLVEG